ncbi:hypothetical protein HG530_013287 [Fusarium avenaceum]|nr:hypothetical protein HG530_013287 [Fusarium avenaceum]
MAVICGEAQSHCAIGCNEFMFRAVVLDKYLDQGQMAPLSSYHQRRPLGEILWSDDIVAISCAAVFVDSCAKSDEVADHGQLAHAHSSDQWRLAPSICSIGRNPTARYEVGNDIVMTVFDGGEEGVDDVCLDTVGFVVGLPFGIGCESLEFRGATGGGM